jgi:UDP-2,3-diacylglucosamine pyrophosphatase LpxH
MKHHYRAIFISDIHLGSKGTQANQLCHFLKHNECERLYLVGDIIDVWKLKRKVYWPQEHSNVIRRVLTKAKRGTKVLYIVGNHDEMLRKWMNFDLQFGNISIVNETIHEGIDGKKYLIVHGDLFDGIGNLNRWLYVLGDHAYDFALALNRWINTIRRTLGFSYWPVSRYLKANVKKATNFIFQFETNLATYCAKQGYDGVVCGHIHTPEIRQIGDVLYMNDGDWVESCTALVETYEGEFKIIQWHEFDNLNDLNLDLFAQEEFSETEPAKKPAVETVSS